MAGSEKTLAQIADCFPNADLWCLYTSFSVDEQVKHFGRTFKTTYLNLIPFKKQVSKFLFFFHRSAVESIDLSDYDVVISNSHSFVKNVRTGPLQLHVCYCYSPMRYIYDLEKQYLSIFRNPFFFPVKLFVKWYFSRLRQWDIISTYTVDHFIAISTFIQRRIQKYYSRHSVVINCPVESSYLAKSFFKKDKLDYFVVASRLEPYKKVDLVVEAFGAVLPHLSLKVIGAGTEADRIRKLAQKYKNVEFFGFVDDHKLFSTVADARAFIFPALEDFGIIPVEALAVGTPIICYSRGGSVDYTRLDLPTGVEFNSQTVNDIARGVENLITLQDSLSSDALSSYSLAFDSSQFRSRFRKEVDKRIADFFGSGLS